MVIVGRKSATMAVVYLVLCGIDLLTNLLRRAVYSLKRAPH